MRRKKGGGGGRGGGGEKLQETFRHSSGPFPLFAYACHSDRAEDTIRAFHSAYERRTDAWKGEISVASASSGTDFSRRERAKREAKEGEGERGDKGDESGRARFPSASRYQGRGRTYEVSKRANLPISYLSSFPGTPPHPQFQNVKVTERETERERERGGGGRRRRPAAGGRRGNPSLLKGRSATEDRAWAGNTRRGFPLIS